ncbi:MAG: hypothetical protein HND52_20075 [Ignavibacteriae bacterium]|nr:hypothetical protein [Ignavibacteriota bacterium]NOH00268.1 hypothetical protein [Ignavibacteriota bacterium]
MELFYTISVVFISRLIFLFRDEALSIKDAVIKAVIMIIPLLVFTINLHLILFLIAALIIITGFYFIELKKRAAVLNVSRVIELLLILIAANILFSSSFEITFNENVIASIKGFKKYFRIMEFISIENMEYFWIMFSGVLFVMNELNIVIRILFELFGLISNGSDEQVTDKNELKAGRIIGILERVIIFILVIANQYGAMGLVIAAKAFARFKAMDEKNFAEYVLIGTLLSALLSLFSAVIIKTMLM